MLSAFGIDHGEVSKAFNPMRALKAKGSKAVTRSANKNYQRGFNQQMNARGQPTGGQISPTLGSIAPGFKRADRAYGKGQKAGAQWANRSHENPFA